MLRSFPVCYCPICCSSIFVFSIRLLVVDVNFLTRKFLFKREIESWIDCGGGKKNENRYIVVLRKTRLFKTGGMCGFPFFSNFFFVYIAT